MGLFTWQNFEGKRAKSKRLKLRHLLDGKIEPAKLHSFKIDPQFNEVQLPDILKDLQGSIFLQSFLLNAQPK